MILLLKLSLNLKLLLLTFNLFMILKATSQLRECKKKNTKITSDILVILE
jgi:hypothetical protein